MYKVLLGSDEYLLSYSIFINSLQPDVHEMTSQTLSIFIDLPGPLYHFFDRSANLQTLIISQSIPTGYIPRATPGKIFFERVNPGHPGNFFSLIPCPETKNDRRIPRRWGKFFPNSKKLLLKLAKKILKKLRKLRDSTNFLSGELNKTFIF